ncbi:techylectin-5B-like [Musca autumnalis]|uniref:techylectin-5B-like n=1 Tax=Musca autumnalis TaxID=221902 RepID=UPI003CEA3213
MDGTVNFFRPWSDYKNGFGNSSGEFFIGLERLHLLTNSRPYELLIVMLGQKFSTYDQDNDEYEKACANEFTGAWWYKACHHSNLNGRYLKGTTVEYAQAVNWYQFKGHNYSLKFVEMTIRPR